MKIEAGKLYKSRAGYKVLIYSTDKGSGEHPIHGAIKAEYGNGWVLQTYTLSGHFQGPEEESKLDIVSEWDREGGGEDTSSESQQIRIIKEFVEIAERAVERLNSLRAEL